ncbi:hypothetical protein TSAR_002559 [Trichomalopsis sarcophagae]|uniref:Uncharacterized protein n=1 Tax=Trichomalopsis sarcophagae TaxID=543379 RepID=A0A232FD66_9HYME|nr:hypothetical protein TSAR_002559 [Trichomalopsis sarcophagae]
MLLRARCAARMRNGQLRPRGYRARILSYSRGRREASWYRHQQQERRFCRYNSDPGFLLGRIGAIAASDALSVSTREPPLAPALTGEVRSPRRTG